ncbi:MAG: hypothetical protein ACPG77_09830 [Nannocystaceae bacterium]
MGTHAIVGLSLAACTQHNPPEPPPLPPRPAPTQPQPPTLSQPQWAPRPDARAKAEYERLTTCGEDRLATFNEIDASDERAPTLLLEAAACYEQAGHWAHAIRLLQHLRKLAPEQAQAEDADDRMKVMYQAFLSDRDAAATLQARACGATIIDPPSEASAKVLIEVARCLEQDRNLFTVSLRYRRLAAKRGAGDHNQTKIEALEQQQQKFEQAIEAKGF